MHISYVHAYIYAQLKIIEYYQVPGNLNKQDSTVATNISFLFNDGYIALYLYRVFCHEYLTHLNILPQEDRDHLYNSVVVVVVRSTLHYQHILHYQDHMMVHSKLDE